MGQMFTHRWYNFSKLYICSEMKLYSQAKQNDVIIAVYYIYCSLLVVSQNNRLTKDFLVEQSEGENFVKF